MAINSMSTFVKDKQFRKFCAYGFLKNLRFFDVFFILFFLDKGLSYTQIGGLYAFREIIINLFEVPSGIVADTFGRKRSLVFALLAYIASFIIFYFGQHFYFFMLAMLLYGIGDAFRSGTHKGMIMDYLRMNGWIDQKVSYYGLTRSWSQKGSAISSLIAGILVFINGDYQYVFLFALLPYSLNLINIMSYPEELNFSSKSMNRKTYYLKNTIVQFLHFVKQKNVFRIMNSAALHSAYMKSLKDYIQPVMLHLVVLFPFFMESDATRRSGLVVGFIYFIIYLITSAASKNAHKLLRIRWSSLSYKTLLMGLSFGLICGFLYQQQLFIVALIFFVGIYIIENLRKPILTGEMADEVSAEVFTSILSAQSFMQSLMTILLSITFGILADRFGIGRSLILLTSMLVLFTVAINMLSRRATTSNH